MAIPYDKNIDYSDEIKKAAAAGDYAAAAQYEQQRNAKIAGEGMNYAPTSDYAKYLNYNPNTDYSTVAEERYKSGDKEGAWQALFGDTDSREAKIAGTGADYGKSSRSIWDSLTAQDGKGGNYQDIKALQEQIGSLLQQIRQQPTYENNWGDETYRTLLEQAINMNYDDWTKSGQYQALADRYGRQGGLSMRDVLGQISSRTGGLASSYATAAAQQQYNDYMAQLESAARDAFANERGTLIENAGLARDYGETEYNRWLNHLNQQRQGQGYALDAINQLLGYAYADDEAAYNRSQNAKTDAQNRIYDYLVNQGGSAADLSDELIAASGYTAAELAAMETKQRRNVINNDSPSPQEDTESIFETGKSAVSQLLGREGFGAAYNYLANLAAKGERNAETAAQIINALGLGEQYEAYERRRSNKPQMTYGDYVSMTDNGMGNDNSVLTEQEFEIKKKLGGEWARYNDYEDYLRAMYARSTGR